MCVCVCVCVCVYVGGWQLEGEAKEVWWCMEGEGGLSNTFSNNN